MVTNVPLVDFSNLWLILAPIVAGAAALGAWLARLETRLPAAPGSGHVGDSAGPDHELPAAA
jgi:hypothetical protein